MGLYMDPHGQNTRVPMGPLAQPTTKIIVRFNLEKLLAMTAGWQGYLS